ncbi:MAG: NADH-quinone oxidoreductase subunit NuoN [Burkholderiales bacterium]
MNAQFLNNLVALLPEVALLCLSLLVIVADLWSKHPQRSMTYWLTQFSLAGVALVQWALFDRTDAGYAMGGMVVVDPLGRLLGFFATVALMVSLVYARGYAVIHGLIKGELFTLSMFMLLGIFIMLSSNHFLVSYLGLELMSLSLYALTALRRDRAESTEAAMKYFVLGALASGFLLYGMSMVYGATGSLLIPVVFNTISTGLINNAVLVLGLVFVVAGLCFKLGVVPFHMWVPDVYEGAPTGITLLIAGAPKLAAFALTFRLLVEGMSGLAIDWQQMLMFVAVISLFVGNLAAIAQTNLKRMLAYSTIAQIGFMLLGFTPTVVDLNTSSAANGYGSALFYLVSYVLTTLGTFGIIMVMSRDGFECDKLQDFKGLARRNPWFAAIMGVFMFSLAGIPPTIGFYGKLAVLQALVSTGHSFYIALAVVAVVLSLIGAFYYLRVVKVMYFDDPVHEQPIVAGADVQAVLSINGLAAIVLGIVPGGLMALCSEALAKALSS